MHQKLYKWIEDAIEDRDIDVIDVSAWLANGWSLTPPLAPEVAESARKKPIPSETK